MSITITFTCEDADEAVVQMRYLIGDFVCDHDNTGERDGPMSAVFAEKPAEPAKAEPEIIPPVRKSRARKVETEVQPDVTDIGPVAATELDGTSAETVDFLMPIGVEQRAIVLKSLMTGVMDKRGMETVYALLAEAKVANRTEALKLPDDKLAAFAAALRKAVA